MPEPEIDDLLVQLNAEQREAVTTIEGPVLVVAGAGSGKTRVITYRIPYLMLTGSARPENILALTFTNKAANEMKSRVSTLAQERPPQISTFHAFGSRFLRRHAKAPGLSSDFTILGEDDQRDLIDDCCRELNLAENRYEPRVLLGLLKSQKSKTDPPDLFDSNIRDVFDLYERKKRSSAAVDFDDLLLLPLKILKEVPAISNHYREQFQFVMVDEYQDTNPVQYALLKELVGERANLLVVGDEDQSIYRFRGAQSENIQYFLRDFPQAKIIKLVQNYRSTKTIIKAAQAVIAQNSDRIKKELWTENPAGNPIEVYHAFDEYDESAFVTLRVMAALSEMKPSEIGVLYRANAQSRVIEESFVKAQIPHHIVGGVGFYERREVRDSIAYLRVMHNPEDSVSLARILNVPPRGVGKKMLEQIQSESQQKNISLYRAAHEVGGKALVTFLNLIEAPALQTASERLKQFLEQIGYFAFLQKEDPASAEDRKENVQEFLSLLQLSETQEGFSLGEFLGDLPLASQTEDARDAVTLLTVHSAKGLEFRQLFVVGLEEGLFPHIRSMAKNQDVEEERRLFYVAMTRAKEALTLSWAQKRGLYGGVTASRPSRFLEEVPSWFQVNRLSERFSSPSVSVQSGVSAAESDPGSKYRVGNVVLHEKLGRGTVMRVEGAPDDWKLTIRFPDGVKTILTRYARLTIER